MTPANRAFCLPTCVLSTFVLAAAVHNSASADEPATPKIVELKIFPEQLQLSDLRDDRTILVTGKYADGREFDLSADAKLSSAGNIVGIDVDGYVVPKQAGETEVVIQAGGLETKVAVSVKDVSSKPVSFIRDVMPLMSKVGCNAGTCHGGQKGKGGFKLSLRGYDPLFDYRASVDDLAGRRFNRALPAQSLMLLKPAQGVPHEGGFLFDEESRQYQLIHQWIAEGCRFDGKARAERLEVFPKNPLLGLAGETQQQMVIAHFSDGLNRDVTRDVVYETSDFEVATVSDQGQVTAVRRGEAAVLMRYEGAYATNPVTVVGDRSGFQWNDSPAFNLVDTHVNKKLERMKILPSELCTDAEFLRRISFDLTGMPPNADQLRAFVADERDSQTKRAAKIDELLTSPEYVDHWTLKWSDLLLSNRKFIKEKGIWAFRNWIRRAIATNQPYNEFTYELMTASGSTFENPAANYYRIAREPKVVMENMTQVFIGTRFVCVQCHDHPFEKWTQDNYYGLAAYFANVGRKKGTLPGDEIIYPLRKPVEVIHPGTGQNVPASFPYTHEGVDEQQTDMRRRLAGWLTAKENPYFAKSIVNRYWSYFTGRGIIDPVDDIRSSNPPSNPELLEALTENFIASGFNLKQFIHTIVSSHTYQRSYRPNEWNEKDTINYSHATPRRLSAEQLFDAILVATDSPANIPGVPAGFRATQLPDPNVKVNFLDMFGRAPRESPCECERSSAVSLAQTLNLINGPTVADAIAHKEGLIARLISEKADNQRLIEEVYVSVVCRYPTEEEAQNAAAYLTEINNPAEAAQDIMWALINSSAFLFNR